MDLLADAIGAIVGALVWVVYVVWMKPGKEM